jgi:hypothetical protein
MHTYAHLNALGINDRKFLALTPDGFNDVCYRFQRHTVPCWLNLSFIGARNFRVK